MTAAHMVRQEAAGASRRWVCSCGWGTPWNTYTDPSAAADAVRHAIRGE